MSACSWTPSTAVHPIDFALGRRIPEGPRERGSGCEVVRMSVSGESNTSAQAIGPVPNGHCKKIQQ